MPDTRGDVLCPTCGQWTPPAPYCTECGAALQLGFQDAGDPGVFRRGHEVDQPGAPWSSQAERFEPEPEDQAAAAVAAGAAAQPRIDHLAEPEPPPAPTWPDEPGLGGPAPAAVEPPAEPPSDVEAAVPPPPPKRRTRAKAATTAAAAAVVAGAAASEPSLVEPLPPFESAPVEPIPPVATPPATQPPAPPLASPPAAPPPVTYAGTPRDGGDDGNSGVSGLVFVVFLGIGVLALLGGAILGGVFDGPVAEASPTPSAAVSTPTPEPTPEPSASSSPAASAAPSATPAITPPPAGDGFVARAEPCAEQPSDSTCDNSGAVNDGSLWILVSFRHGSYTDVIGVSIRDSSGSVQDEGSFGLNFCGDSTDCAGYTYFAFSGFGPGVYNVEATRNGTPAATTSFTVE